MLTIRNMHKRFGRNPVLRNMNLELADGEFVTLLGPSGCGKTTLLRIIAGLEVPDEGEVWLDDQLLVGPDVFMTPQDRNFGMVFQSYALWPHMTIRENLAYPLEARRHPAGEIDERIDGMLTSLGLDGLGGRRPAELSGGQQQRVALGRALIARPRLLLLDEPLSNVDAKVRQDMRTTIRRVQQRLGLTAVYVTHDQSEALSLSDRIVVINRGAIEQRGTPTQIYHRPASRFVADFMGNNILAATVQRRDAAGIEAMVNALGQTVTLAPHEGTHDGLARGDDIQLSVHPEAVRITPADQATAGHVASTGGRGGSEPTLAVASFLGDRVEVDVDCGDGTTLRGRFAAGLNPPPAGNPVTVTIDPADVVLLPRATPAAPAAAANPANANARTAHPTETLS
ncbi:MAG: ABC transporter ATP-binding protein [Burkholderiaceae bacterium]